MTEKEKYNKFSGRFVTCIYSFSVFECGKTYWLEYIGNNLYIGRSDNILNKTIRIEPCYLKFLE